MQFFKRPAEIIVHRVQAQAHVLSDFLLRHALRDTTQDFGFLLGKPDALSLLWKLLKCLKNQSSNLWIERHAAFRHVIKGPQDFECTSGFDEITMCTCLERGEHLFTVMEGGEDEYPCKRKLFPDLSDPFQSTHARQAQIQEHEIGLEAIRDLVECFLHSGKAADTLVSPAVFKSFCDGVSEQGVVLNEDEGNRFHEGLAAFLRVMGNCRRMVVPRFGDVMAFMVPLK